LSSKGQGILILK